MNEKDLKIGYVPYLPDLSQPGDRRRFPRFALRNRIPFDIADPNKHYDIILLTASSNLTLWLKYRKNHRDTKFLFEMVDNLVFPYGFLNTWAKGTGRFLLGKENKPVLEYKRILDQWISLSDAVICSNNILLDYVLKKNKNAVLSPDYLESEYTLRKKTFEITGKMKIVWEGQASVLPHFLAFKNVFKRISGFSELNIISELKYPAIPKLLYRDVNNLLKKLPIETHFHEWNPGTHNKLLTEGDCAIIPLNPKNQFGWNKPANKLISFWFCGLPAVVSGTPAYKEIMTKAGSDFFCNDEEEWFNKIKMIYELTPEERMEIADKNYSFVKKFYSDEELDKVWEKIFSFVS